MIMALALAAVLHGRYLALGDSYTIGESVAANERFPVQLAQTLKLGQPQIIAKTGWTTDELNAAIDAADPKGPFGLVTLCVVLVGHLTVMRVCTL